MIEIALIKKISKVAEVWLAKRSSVNGAKSLILEKRLNLKACPGYALSDVLFPWR